MYIKITIVINRIKLLKTDELTRGGDARYFTFKSEQLIT